MNSLPAGVVTFLLTDIQGSSKLWEQAPAEMRTALIHHDAILSGAVAGHEGFVIKSRGEGDSVFAVFARPLDALQAACAIQQALLTEPWPTPAPISVRMAIHTGEAELRDGDYYGPTVNRCARLRAIAHGGQVILSGTAAGLVRGALDGGLGFLPLGTHRLKDLAEPEEVFQLTHPALPERFPPLQSLSALPNNLPVQTTRFIGREKEMAEVRRLMGATRLLTLTGAGGTGKTRLALQVAAESLEAYPDGVWLVELDALSDPALVLQTVCGVVGVKEEPGRQVQATLIGHLQPRRTLLILDNCEHLVSTLAPLTAAILRSCPQVAVLATSRAALSIAGETTWQVPPLGLPDPRHLPPIETLSMYEAVRLFVDRALAAQPAFAVTTQNAPALAEICHRLDGIPLAIELAAARVKVLTPEQIAARLDDRFRLLTGGSRAALPRQQTLKALVGWSHDLLTEQEQALWRRLSVFRGGFDLEAAEAVCAGEAIEAWEVLDLVAQLVDKSLVVTGATGDQSRYRLLETIRQFGEEKLREAAEEALVRDRHKACFLALTEEARPELVGPNGGQWFARLSRELDNVRAALQWCAETDAVSGLALAANMGWFWHMQGYSREGRSFVETFLNATPADPTPVRGRALHAAGLLATDLGDLAAGLEFSRLRIEVARALGDKKSELSTLNNMGNVYGERGDAQALTIFRELVRQYEELGALGHDGMVPLNNLVLYECLSGNIDESWRLAAKALAYAQTHHGSNPAVLGITKGQAAVVAAIRGDLGSAAALGDEAMRLLEAAGYRQYLFYGYITKGWLEAKMGDRSQALALLGLAAQIVVELGLALPPRQYVVVAVCLAESGIPEAAAEVAGYVEALLRQYEAKLWPVDQQFWGELKSRLKETLGAERFVQSYDRGRHCDTRTVNQSLLALVTELRRVDS